MSHAPKMSLGDQFSSTLSDFLTAASKLQTENAELRAENSTLRGELHLLSRRAPMLQFECMIGNGYIDADTFHQYTQRGYNFVTVVPAQLVHPRAMPTDKAAIFVKFTPVVTADTSQNVGLDPTSRS